MLVTPRPNLQLCARVAPIPGPGVGLGVKMYKRSDITLIHVFTFAFLLKVIT